MRAGRRFLGLCFGFFLWHTEYNSAPQCGLMSQASEETAAKTAAILAAATAPMTVTTTSAPTSPEPIVERCWSEEIWDKATSSWRTAAPAYTNSKGKEYDPDKSALLPNLKPMPSGSRWLDTRWIPSGPWVYSRYFEAISYSRRRSEYLHLHVHISRCLLVCPLHPSHLFHQGKGAKANGAACSW
jgi:hypothetical protein